MNLIKTIGTIASSSVMSQAIGALSLWLIAHTYGMAEVGNYAQTYSIALIGAQLCTFASPLLLPKQSDAGLAQNIVFCLLQSCLLAVPYSLIVATLCPQSLVLIYLLNVAYAWILVSENLLMRAEKMRYLALQRLSVSLLVFGAILVSLKPAEMYWVWAGGLGIVMCSWLAYSVKLSTLQQADWRFIANWQFYRDHRIHINQVGSAEVLAIASANLPTILINFWFSALTAGYFAVVSRFCLAPVMIVGNAVRHSIFAKWSVDYRYHRFNAVEFIKVRHLLLGLGCIATAGVFFCYPVVMQLSFSAEWVDSVPTSRYLLPYLFPALAVCPLTVVELVFGSATYFLRVQIEQLLVVLLAFVVLPFFHADYALAVVVYAWLSALRYACIYLKVNRRAVSLQEVGFNHIDFDHRALKNIEVKNTEVKNTDLIEKDQVAVCLQKKVNMVDER